MPQNVLYTAARQDWIRPTLGLHSPVETDAEERKRSKPPSGLFRFVYPPVRPDLNTTEVPSPPIRRRHHRESPGITRKRVSKSIAGVSGFARSLWISKIHNLPSSGTGGGERTRAAESKSPEPGKEHAGAVQHPQPAKKREGRDVKRQILQELMKINRVPPSYFLLGRAALNCNFDIDLDEVVDMVNISANDDDQIVIRPKQLDTSQGSLVGKTIIKHAATTTKASASAAPSESVSYNRSILMPNKTAELDTTLPRAATSCEDYKSAGSVIATQRSKGKRPPRILSPIKSRSPSGGGSGSVTAKASTNGSKVPPLGKKAPVQSESKPKIKIWHEPDNHLVDHPINKLFRLINEITRALTKTKDATATCIDSNNLILSLCKKLPGTSAGPIVTRAELTEPARNKESIIAVKEKLLRTLYSELNRENGLNSPLPVSAAGSGYVKFYVGNGNNPMIVKSVLKQRWWWTAAESKDAANLVWTQWKKNSILDQLPCCLQKPAAKPESETETMVRMCNHVEGNVHLGNKKGLYYNVKSYYQALKRDAFSAIPLTFHVKSTGDPEYARFKEAFTSHNSDGKNVWIVKPGENSNRGNGIAICQSVPEVEQQLAGSDSIHTKIVQQYIEHPLLYNKRKFDIRCYSLVTAFNGMVKGYFYKDGYLRTASKEFTLKSLRAKSVHLTNEAIQRNYDDFGKFEPGNKLTYAELQKYLDATPGLSELAVDFESQILPQIKKLITDSMRAVHGKLDPNGRQYTFEIFGYDFMIDSEFHVFLIEANINPCLEILSPVTARIVPAMLDSAIRIAVDPIFQPPAEMSLARKSVPGDLLPEIRHELIYDSIADAKELDELARERHEAIPELEEEEGEEEGSGPVSSATGNEVVKS